MNECILTNVFGIEDGYELVRSEDGVDSVRLHLKVRDARLICPECESHEVSRKGRRHRSLQTVPIGLTPVYLVAEVPDCQCRECGHRFEVAPPLPPPIDGSPIDWWRSCKTSRKSCV
jgi:transposase